MDMLLAASFFQSCETVPLKVAQGEEKSCILLSLNVLYYIIIRTADKCHPPTFQQFSWSCRLQIWRKKLAPWHLECQQTNGVFICSRNVLVSLIKDQIQKTILYPKEVHKKST